MTDSLNFNLVPLVFSLKYFKFPMYVRRANVHEIGLSYNFFLYVDDFIMSLVMTSVTIRSGTEFKPMSSVSLNSPLVSNFVMCS